MSYEKKMTEFIDQHVEIIKPLCLESSLAWWDNALTGSDDSAQRAAEINAQLMKIYANPDEYAFLKSIPKDEIHDPLIARQHDMLLRGYEGEQMSDDMIDRMVKLDTEISQEYNNFRADVNGESMLENDIRKVLSESTDLDLRKAAWEGSKRIGARVEERVLELVKLRNQVARDQGYTDHYAKSYHLSELDLERVFNQFDALAALTDPIWEEWKSRFDIRQASRLGITVEELRPWHYTDQFFQEAPAGTFNLDQFFTGKSMEELTRSFYSSIGLPVDDVMSRSDLYEKPGKNQHAFCTDIDHEGDVRVLCNVRSNEHWMGTMLHEFGHAVYDKYTDYSLPFMLRGPSHTLSTEAIAEMMGRFSSNALWLKLYAGIPQEKMAELNEATLERERSKFLVVTRWFFVMCYFEREMYRNPDQDLNKLWWDMVERYQGIHRPDDRNEPDWASKLHLALAPVYYQNYLLGEMFAAQILSHIRRVVLQDEAAEALFISPKVGQWLKERIFTPAAVRPWEDGLEYATGEALNPAYYAAQLK